MTAALRRLTPALEPPAFRSPQGHLARRLERARHADAIERAALAHGVDTALLDALVERWRHELSQERPRATLARQPWLRLVGAPSDLCFAHRRARDAAALPLLVLHGAWGPLVELATLVERLCCPETGDEAFHVVTPALPGFGVSAATRPVNACGLAQTCQAVMAGLGYERYVVHGSGVGATVAAHLAALAPDNVAALHVTALQAFPRSAEELRSLDGGEKSQLARLSFERAELGEAPPRSPLGDLASALAQLSDWDAPTDAFIPLLHSLSVAWAWGDAAARLRLQRRESFRASPAFRAPVILETYPLDLPCLSRLVQERYRVVKQIHHERGGQLPALEAPDRLLSSLRASFAPYR